MRQTEINIYIGSDNASRKINEEYLAKITEWAKQVFPNGFTLIKGKGFYGDISEDSVILTVISHDPPKLKKCVKALKKTLKQECILVSQKPTMVTAMEKAFQECPYWFGYLKTLPKNSAIPDGCLTCPKVSKCFVSMGVKGFETVEPSKGREKEVLIITMKYKKGYVTKPLEE